MKKIILGLNILLSMILISSFALAFAVSVPPLQEGEGGSKLIYMMPGEEYGLGFTLQNGGGATSDVEVVVDIIQGDDIMDIVGSKNYNVPAGGRVEVNTMITIPSDYPLGNSYDVVVAFTTEGAPGGFSFGSRIEQRFKVILGKDVNAKVPELAPENEEGTRVIPTYDSAKPNMNIVVLSAVIVIIILAIIFFLVLRKKKRK